MYPNSANPYPAYPTYLPQHATLPGQTAAQTLPYITQPQRPQPSIPSQQIVNLIFGRVVQSESEITPQEVAMDGSISLFPLSDYTCIIAKQWNSDGTIKTLRFVPQIENAQEDISTDESFLDHFDKRMDELMTAVNKRQHYNKNQYRGKEDKDAVQSQAIRNGSASTQS